MAKLVINPTSAAKKEIPIVTRVISIGRDPSNDLVLSDSMVSRRHAILEHRDNQYILRDNNSSNGTMVNGDRVDMEKPLRDGDLVAIGSSRLLFQLDETAEASGPPIAPLKPRPVPHEPAHAPARAPVAGEVRCGHCGKTALVGDRFCRGCGRELAAEKKSITCSQCGNEVRLPAEFCGRCGKALAGREKPPFLSTRPHRSADLEAELVKGGSDEVPAVAPASSPPKPRPRPAVATEAKTGEAAGFGIRFLAFLIDEMILGIPLLLGGLASMSFPVAPTPTLVSAAVSLYSLFGLLYYIYFWGARGATPGKSLLGLTVVTETGATPIGYGRALLRLLGYAVSSFLLGLGFLLIAFSPDRRGLHDRIAGTRVEEELVSSSTGASEKIVEEVVSEDSVGTVPVPAPAGAEAASPVKPQRFQSLVDLLHDLAIAVVVCVLLITYVVQAFKVQGTSMSPELKDGERILVNKFLYYVGDITRGDVVVFWYPEDPQLSFIKRVVALPGETVEIRSGAVFVNGTLIEEPYVAGANADLRSFPPHEVRPGHFFVLGDNRKGSNDSRSWGLVPERYIYGKAFLRIWPPSDVGVVN